MYPMNGRTGPNFVHFKDHQASESTLKFLNQIQTEKKFKDIDVENGGENSEKADHQLKKVVIKNFHDYCDSSTIHGVKYIGQGQRQRIER